MMSTYTLHKTLSNEQKVINKHNNYDNNDKRDKQNIEQKSIEKQYKQLLEDKNTIQKMIFLEENENKKDMLEQTYKHIQFNYLYYEHLYYQNQHNN